MKKKALYKKWMSMLLAGVVTTSGFMGKQSHFGQQKQQIGLEMKD